jgi:hypothetical protein
MQRLASELIDQLVNEAKKNGMDGLYLYTFPFLTGARRLWEKKGWEVIGQDQDGVWDTIHMFRWLGEK